MREFKVSFIPYKINYPHYNINIKNIKKTFICNIMLIFAINNKFINQQ